MVGRGHSLVRAAIQQWEDETGNKSSRPKTWRDNPHNRRHPHDEPLTVEMKSSRDLVIAELDRRRDLGIPFKIAEVAESTGCSTGTISTYSRHYADKIAEKLINQAIHTIGKA